MKTLCSVYNLSDTANAIEANVMRGDHDAATWRWPAFGKGSPLSMLLAITNEQCEQ
jgi:hypothetical protein